MTIGERARAAAEEIVTWPERVEGLAVRRERAAIVIEKAMLEVQDEAIEKAIALVRERQPRLEETMMAIFDKAIATVTEPALRRR